MDIYSTQVLSKVVERLHTPPSFLLDTFFPNVQTSDKEEIFFDITDSKRVFRRLYRRYFLARLLMAAVIKPNLSNRLMLRINADLMPTFRINVLPVKLSAAVYRRINAMNALWPLILKTSWRT